MPDINNPDVITEVAGPDIPQLSTREKTNAVILVLGAITISLFIIISLWPANTVSNKDAPYTLSLFHVQPVTSVTGANKRTEYISLNKRLAELNADINNLAKPTDASSQKRLKEDRGYLADTQAKLRVLDAADPGCQIQLGSLLLILVAAFGFLGNMIHVSRSLTFYVGMKQFQRSWIPWYFIKPFTAAGLALLIYFSTNTTTSSINLFSIMLTAGLTGLFADIALQKLKVIFEAILKPADTHSPAADAKNATVDMSKVIPDRINPRGENSVKIPGTNLNPKTVTVQINESKINPITVTATEISFLYQPEGDEQEKTEFLLKVTDKTANLDAGKKWGV